MRLSLFSMARVARLACLALLLVPAALSGQLPNAATRALGMGGNYTALARGFAAGAWNPALLGLPDNPGFSITIAPITALAGLGPVDGADLKEVAGDTVSRAVRLDWMEQIEAEGRQRGSGGADVTELALSMGPIALQISSVVRTIMDLSPGATELLLFGNAGRTGSACSCALGGSSFQGAAFSTAALSLGKTVSTSDTGRRIALGATAKYTTGHGLVYGRDLGSTVTPEPSLDLDFPFVMPDTATEFHGVGSGMGLDIGVALQGRDLTIAATVQNVVQTYEWKDEELAFRPGTAVIERGESSTDFDQRPLASAPQELRTFVDDATFKPAFLVGIGYLASDRLTVSADLRARTGDNALDPAPKFHLGAGAELRLPLLSLRAGAAKLDEGYQLAGGAGLRLGPLRLEASVLTHQGGATTNYVTMFTLLSSGSEPRMQADLRLP